MLLGYLGRCRERLSQEEVMQARRSVAQALLEERARRGRLRERRNLSG
jgi:hypothetical protein